MAKIKTTTTSKPLIGFSEKTGALYLIGIVLFLVLFYFGLTFYKNMPEVSYNDIKAISVTYHSELTALEDALKTNYNSAIEAKDLEAWSAFTQEWVSKIGAARPVEYDLKLSKKSREIVNSATFMSRDLFQLWTEYNTAITTGEPLSSDIEKTLLNNLASGHAFLNKELQ